MPEILQEIMLNATAKHRTILCLCNEIPLLKPPQRLIPPVAPHQPGTISLFHPIASFSKKEGRWPLIL
jgi:hypothetical protein